MRNACSIKTLKKFQLFEGSQDFSTNLREKDSLLIRFQRKAD